MWAQLCRNNLSQTEIYCFLNMRLNIREIEFEIRYNHD